MFEGMSYATLVTKRDRFIYAAIQATDEKMKALWVHRAEQVSEKLKEISECSIHQMSL